MDDAEANAYSQLRDARADEVERCAQLVTMRANIARESAAKLRGQGVYTIRAIWPPFRKYMRVVPKWEKAAQDMEHVAHAFDVVADIIRKGYDPRTLKRCSTCDGSCGSPSSCTRPR